MVSAFAIERVRDFTGAGDGVLVFGIGDDLPDVLPDHLSDDLPGDLPGDLPKDLADLVTGEGGGSTLLSKLSSGGDVWISASAISGLERSRHSVDLLRLDRLCALTFREPSEVSPLSFDLFKVPLLCDTFVLLLLVSGKSKVFREVFILGDGEDRPELLLDIVRGRVLGEGTSGECKELLEVESDMELPVGEEFIVCVSDDLLESHHASVFSDLEDVQLLW